MWAAALGAGVFAVMALIGQTLAFLQAAAAPTSISGSTVARLGLLYFYAFHHAGIVISVPGGRLAPLEQGEAGVPFSVSYTISVALLLVTALAILLLLLAARWVADRSGGGIAARAVNGMKVAPAYALLSLGLSYIDAFRFDLPANPFLSGEVHVGPGHVGAFLWPLGIAVVAGGLGGLSTAWAELAAYEPWGRRVAGGLRGGWRMFAYGLALAFVGVLVLAGLKPEATRAYVRATAGAGLVGADAMAHHVLALPNQSLWVLVPAMGSCDGAYGAGRSVDFLCYWRFPKGVDVSAISEGTTSSAGFARAPVPYFLFLLVPLGAVVLGGGWAGANGGADTWREGATIGAAAGVVFALLVLAGTVLGGVGISLSGGLNETAQGSGSGTVGPNIFTGTAAALLWGVLGGAVGGAFGVRLRPRS